MLVKHIEGHLKGQVEDMAIPKVAKRLFKGRVRKLTTKEKEDYYLAKDKASQQKKDAKVVKTVMKAPEEQLTEKGRELKQQILEERKNPPTLMDLLLEKYGARKDMKGLPKTPEWIKQFVEGIKYSHKEAGIFALMVANLKEGLEDKPDSEKLNAIMFEHSFMAKIEDNSKSQEEHYEFLKDLYYKSLETEAEESAKLAKSLLAAWGDENPSFLGKFKFSYKNQSFRCVLRKGCVQLFHEEFNEAYGEALSLRYGEKSLYVKFSEFNTEHNVMKVLTKLNTDESRRVKTWTSESGELLKLSITASKKHVDRGEAEEILTDIKSKE